MIKQIKCQCGCDNTLTLEKLSTTSFKITNNNEYVGIAVILSEEDKKALIEELSK